MFCSKCGEKLEEGTKFCVKCGNKVDGDIPAAQSGSQTTMPPAQEIPQNSASNTANKTVTCQGCTFGGKKCTYYNCTISEAEKYDCGMRGAPELQKKQATKNLILVGIFLIFVILDIFFKINIFAKIAALLGINIFNNSSLNGFIICLCFCGICSLIDIGIKKKRRENAKRL